MVDLSSATITRIVALARVSVLARREWKDRGVAPIGYTCGMAAAFAVVYAKWKAGDSSARVMAMANTGDERTDALAHYAPQFSARGMSNAAPGADTLRHLFVLLIGLGMRESGGKHCCGRDTSAANVQSDTAEAGLFQQSWNSHVASMEMVKLFDAWKGKPDPLLPVFAEGVRCNAIDLANFGGGDGARFQALCKGSPSFAVEVAAVGLRVIGGKAPRGHWGPISRREVELASEADTLLKAVAAIVDDVGVNGGVVATPAPPIAPAAAPAPNTADWPPKPAFAPLVSNDARVAIFGRFGYDAAPVAGNPERVVIRGSWQTHNIVWVPIPQMAKRKLGEAGAIGGMLFHRLGVQQLLGMWAAWEEAGLLDRVLEFDGSFVPRFVRGSTETLSNHAFGTAFDINYAQNQLGHIPALAGSLGSVRELVPIANQFGFYWGGHYGGRPDGMHFELAKILSTPVVTAQNKPIGKGGVVVGTGIAAAGSVAAFAHWFGAHPFTTVAIAAGAGVAVMLIVVAVASKLKK